MALADNWESFIRIHGGEPGARDMFEKAMDDMLRAENPDKEVHIVKASQGDGGIDVFIYREEGIDIYQCKFFMGAMNASRWKKIEESFDRAMKLEGIHVLRWFLCMPREMQKEDISKWDQFKKGKRKFSVEIRLIDGNEIITRMTKCDRLIGTNLVERYFDISKNIHSYPKCLTSYMPVGPEIGLVGRNQIVGELRTRLDEANYLVLVSGIGGIGKTAVMQQVCENIYNDGNETNHVAWITCGESLEDDLLILREPLGIARDLNRDDSYAAVLRELSHFNGQLYLFMDDLTRVLSKQELGTINALRRRVHVMITARHEIEGAFKVDLSELDEDYAVDMFYGYYKLDRERKYKEDVLAIIKADTVRSHTLLVELLAKAANRSFDSLNIFRQNLEENGFFKVSRVRLDTGHDENRTIEESIRRLYDNSNLSAEQKRIMSLFTIMTPEKEIYGAIVNWARLDENAIEELVKLGWIVRTEGGFIIHQITRDSLAKQMDGVLKIEEYGRLLDKVADTDSYLPKDLEYMTVRKRMVLVEDVAVYITKRLERLFAESENGDENLRLLINSTYLFHNTGDVCFRLGDYEKAKTYYEKAVDIWERKLRFSPNATIYNNIGNVLRVRGNYYEALHYYEIASGIYEGSKGPEEAGIITVYCNTAGVYKALGNYNDALKYYEKAIDFSNQRASSSPMDMVATYNEIAKVFLAQGNCDRALEYCNKAITVIEHEKAQNGVTASKTYNVMSFIYLSYKELKAAEEYGRKALSIRERVLGPRHPVTASTYNNMANIKCAQGAYKEAKEFYDKALNVRLQSFGAEHPSLANLYNDIGDMYSTLEDYKNALHFFNKVLPIRKRVMGSGHLLTAKAHSNIAEACYALGDYETALKHYRASLVVYSDKLGTEHPYTQETQLSIMVLEMLIDMEEEE